MSGYVGIHGFPARDSDRVVLLYRRSKRETWMLQLTGKATQKVTAGSSFTGFFEPDRCDLSADGSRFLYYAIGRDTRLFDSQFKYWTAICKPPYVRALAFFPHRARDGGGGRIDEAGAFHISPGSNPAFDPTKPDTTPKLDIQFTEASGPRLCDWGWSVDVEEVAKPWKNESLIRRETASSRSDGFVGGAYSLAGHEDPHLQKASWADIDSQNRLMMAQGSVLSIYNSLKSLQQDRGAHFDLAEVLAQKNG